MTRILHNCKAIVLLALVGALLFVLTTGVASAEPNAQINYQGKLTDSSGIAVTDGTYNVAFKLYTTPTGSTEVWTSTTTVVVTNGLFSYMLGSDDALTSVDFNQTLYLGVNIGGTGAPSWDGEMTPRKVLGTVPAAFEAFELGGVASSSFLRSDQADTMSASEAATLLTITQSGTGDILNLFDGGSEVFTVIDGGQVGIGTTSPIAELSIDGDLALTGGFYDNNYTRGTNGQVMQTTGSGVQWVATSSLGFGTGDGSVTSVALSAPTGFTVGGSPITTAGTLALSYTAGYEGLLTASSTNWNTFYNTPSTRITDGTGLTWAGNSLTLTNDFGASIDESELNIAVAPTNGYVLQASSTAAGGFVWQATSTLGVGDGTFLGLSDTQSSFTANRVPFTNSGGTALTDSSSFVFNGTGLGIGTSTPNGVLDLFEEANSTRFNAYTYSDTSWHQPTFRFYRARGDTIGAVDAVQDGDEMFEIASLGYGTSAFNTGMTITSIVDGAPSGNNIPMRINFSTRDTSGTFAQRMTIRADGNVGIGTSTPSRFFSIDGDLYATGALYDNANSAGTNGMVLQTDGAGFNWVATSTLGIGASFSNSSELAALLSDETGTGLSVFSISPTLDTAIFTGTTTLATTTINNGGLYFAADNYTISNPPIKFVAPDMTDAESSKGNIIEWGGVMDGAVHDYGLATYAYQQNNTATFTAPTGYKKWGWITTHYDSPASTAEPIHQHMNFETVQSDWLTAVTRLQISFGEDDALVSFPNSHVKVFNDKNFQIGTDAAGLYAKHDTAAGRIDFTSTSPVSWNSDMKIGSTSAPGATLDVEEETDQNILRLKSTLGSANGSAQLLIQGTTAGGVAIQTGLTSEGTNRFSMNTSGRMEWGAGATSRDVTLYRSGADTLQTDDQFTVLGTTTIGAFDGDEVLQLLGQNGSTQGSRLDFAESASGNGFAFIHNTASNYLELHDTLNDIENVRFYRDGGDLHLLNGEFMSDGTGDNYLLGNLGVGTTSPASKLDVWGDFRVGISSTPTLFVDVSTGNIGVGNSSPTAKFDVRQSADNVGTAVYGFDDESSEFMHTYIDSAGNSHLSASTVGYLTTLAGSPAAWTSSLLTLLDNKELGFGDAVDYSIGYNSIDDTLRFVDGSDVSVDASTRLIINSSGNVGIGTTTPNGLLSLDAQNITGSGAIAGIDKYFEFENSTNGAVVYGGKTYINATNTATTTMVGDIIRLADTTTFGNTVRGFEVQTNKGGNTQGENTALSGFARTFGVRGFSSGDAGGTFEPAGGFFETGGTTQGNAMRGYSSTITTASLLSLFQDTSSFTGTGLEMNFGNTTGDFASTSSKYLDFQNGGTSVFTVTAYGTTTIGDGTTSNQAGLQIGYGGICVDNDGTCSASTTGRITAVESLTGNSDLAELYFSSQDLEPGEIVVLSGDLSVDRAHKSSDTPIVGVVSTKPGLTLGFDDISTQEGETGYPIALSGRVPVKLSTENGPIKKGDQLMLSSLPGIAMKATSTGAIVGIALENFDDDRMYSDTYINQFGDDVAEPVYTPITQNTDTRIHDGCYYGGGGAAGEASCTPLAANDIAGQIAEANEIVEEESLLEAIEDLKYLRAKTRTLSTGETVKVGQVVMFVDLSYRWVDEQQLATLDGLVDSGFAALTEEYDDDTTVLGRLVALADGFVEGILSVFTLKADRVEVANELCVDDVCVTANDLRALLETANGNDEQIVEVFEEEEVIEETENDYNTAENTSDLEENASSTEVTASSTSETIEETEISEDSSVIENTELKVTEETVVYEGVTLEPESELQEDPVLKIETTETMPEPESELMDEEEVVPDPEPVPDLEPESELQPEPELETTE